jgi:hypothetical protein
MIIKRTSTRKGIACFFLTLLFVQGLTPSVAWALTSGPSQPETKQFAQAGTSDMVDLATGNFKYNIPLLDVDGYPVNLSYQSGSGVDEEASWVGLGWNLNAGAINRQLRGIADDSYGDELTTESYMKPKITAGGSATVRGEVFGSGITGSVSVGIFSDNYTGIGAEVGVNAGLSLTKSNSCGLTPGVNIGLSSNTSSGVSVTPSISLSLNSAMDGSGASLMGMSASLGYNTREGLKSLSFGGSLNLGLNADFTQTIDYNTPPFYPKTNIPFKSSNFTFRADLGGAAVGIFGAIGATGYKTKREVKDPIQHNRTYGFMYAEKGKGVSDAMMDFMREKDNPIIPELHNLAMPVITPDLFSYTSQAGSGQLRLYRNGTGVIFDNETNDVSDNTSASVEYGGGYYFHAGVSIFNQDIKSTNGKWKSNNAFLGRGDYAPTTAVEEEDAYFKEAGEKNTEDQTYNNLIQGEEAVRIPLDGKSALGQLQTASGTTTSTTPDFKKTGRQVKRSPVLMLTAEKARIAGLDKKIKNYPFLDTSFAPTGCNQTGILPEDRLSGVKKKNHISEMTITGDDGKRMVYGLPVYNIRQDEYSFAVDGSNADKVKNLIKFPMNADGTINHKPLNAKGKSTTDEYYHKESQPAYASSFLLTGILSPDYVDVGNDGITEDDRGTAIKFNYSKLASNFQWRAPYGLDTATYNRGLNADPDDDKASFVCGEKELWYLQSIESRTKIAYFITEDRNDAFGYDWIGNKMTNVKQKRLKEIRLYSKNDLSQPIKTVVLDYSYELCKKIPNSNINQGKLTLKSVYFKYASSTRGSHNPYVFNYSKNDDYAYVSSDRWGTYKPITNNGNDGFGDLKNDEFPYATRNAATAAQNVTTWQLTTITLPTGGVIDVNYESDDYAYVQNRRAMQMVKFTGMVDGSDVATTSLRDAKKFKVAITDAPPSGTDPTEWFKQKYLNGESYMYARFFVNVSDEPTSTDVSKYDFVPGYGAVDKVVVQNNEAIITFKVDKDGGINGGVNPFISVAWQRMRFDYPRYAYPGYKNKIDDDRPVTAIVTALANSIKNISELWENFNKRAYRKNFAAGVNMDKSFGRIVKKDGIKLGGGLRVKRIKMSDKWSGMSGDQSDAAYGQEYEYTTIQDGQTISSGVAAYEPSLGGDENPMRLPVNYTQDVKWGLNNYFYLEEPMGESLFPSPEIVYREVKVRNLGASGVADPANKTGWNTYEFYTAKEFPVLIKQTAIDSRENHPKSWSSFFGGKSLYELTMSQGYAITLNDMHGKPKAERVFNQSGQEISSAEYFYNATEEGGIQRLKNVVDVVDSKGNIARDQVIGRDIEMFADMRQSETSNVGKSINIGLDIIPVIIWAIPVPHFPWSRNDDYRLFRSASVLKTIQYYGVVSKVVKKVNGSSVTASNLLYDQLTGEPILTQSNNEFDDPVYSINVPAYWMYKQMGPAYQNLGLVLSGFQATEGVIQGSYASLLTAGDELINPTSGARRWVVNSAKNGTGTPALRLIDGSGRVTSENGTTLRVIRSGYRNLLTAGATAITSMKSPIVDNVLRVFNDEELATFRILNASAIQYNDAWGQPADCNLKSCPTGYQESADGRCYLPPIAAQTDHFNIIAGDKDPKYSDQGAWFFTETQNDISDRRSTKPFWMGGCDPGCGRLAESGIWMKGNVNGHWWGIEKCINIPADGVYNIGYASDNLMGIYIDGKLFYDFHDPTNQTWFKSWRIREKALTAGKHIIQIDAVNADTKRAMAVEIYSLDAATLIQGDATTIANHTIFSTASLEDDNTALVFDADSYGNKFDQSLTCSGGQTLEMCDGTPNCGYKPKGACPEGYTASADGQACVPIGGGEDTASALGLTRAVQNAAYSLQGAAFYNADATYNSRVTDPFWGSDDCGTINTRSSGLCGRLNVSGIWLNSAFDDQWIGMNTCLVVPQSKIYYIGYGADNEIRLYIDGNTFPNPVSPASGSENFLDWKVYPVYLPAGKHILTIEAMNVGGGTDHAVGVEVYNNTLAELQNDAADIIYSTIKLLDGKAHDTYVKEDDENGTIVRQRFSCPSAKVNVCSDTLGCPAIPNGTVLNPYTTGYLGNWLPWKQMTWLSDRSGQLLPYSATSIPDIRHNGHYAAFHAFWIYNNGWSITTNTDWVTSTTSSLYDQFSQELETKDALNMYSSARYGYKSTLPVAVGANMRQREIFYDGFDDYKFNNLCMDSLPCQPDEFNIYKTLGSNYAARLDTNYSHSGNYSLKLNGNDITLKTYVFDNEHAPGIYLTNNTFGEYYRRPDAWLGLRGFCPVPNRRYMFSAWVRDGAPSSTIPGVTLKLHGDIVTLTTKASVEGWKLVEGVLDIPAKVGTGDMAVVNVVLNGASGVYIDDIRIFPYDGQLKTFSYDDKTLRLMAEMDENNYATFYEYDDEGSLIRVKKETERGIMTIKENRSTYRKKN